MKYLESVRLCKIDRSCVEQWAVDVDNLCRYMTQWQVAQDHFTAVLPPRRLPTHLCYPDQLHIHTNSTLNTPISLLMHTQASRRYCNDDGRHFRMYHLRNWIGLDITWQTAENSDSNRLKAQFIPSIFTAKDLCSILT